MVLVRVGLGLGCGFGFSFFLVSLFFWFWVGVLLPLLFGFPCFFQLRPRKWLHFFFLDRPWRRSCSLRNCIHCLRISFLDLCYVVVVVAFDRFGKVHTSGYTLFLLPRAWYGWHSLYKGSSYLFPFLAFHARRMMFFAAVRALDLFVFVFLLLFLTKSRQVGLPAETAPGALRSTYPCNVAIFLAFVTLVGFGDVQLHIEHPEESHLHLMW